MIDTHRVLTIVGYCKSLFGPNTSFSYLCYSVNFILPANYMWFGIKFQVTADIGTKTLVAANGAKVIRKPCVMRNLDLIDI